MAQRPVQEKTFVTAFFRHHGIGYFDVLLRAFANDPHLLESTEKAHKISDQYDLMRKDPKKKQVKAYYLIPKGIGGAVRWVPNRRTEEFKQKWAQLIKSLEREHGVDNSIVKEAFNSIKMAIESSTGSLSLELIEKTWGRNPKYDYHWLWQIVLELPPMDQIEWFKKYSIWKNCETVKIIELGDDHLQPDDHLGWTKAVVSWLDSLSHTDRESMVVNIYGTSSENQFAWYYSAWMKPWLRTVRYIKCQTASSETKPFLRFRSISINEANKDILLDLTKTPVNYSPSVSSKRENCRKWLEMYKDLGDGFSIMILGPRGSGKTEVIKKVFTGMAELNCGIITNDTMALSLLFGHIKGAYTGADQDRKGLFAEAGACGALFLDEIHHLPKGAQSKLLAALQTDGNGNYSFSHLGEDESQKNLVKFQLIVGSNWTLEELRNGRNGEPAPLFPDFLDRIEQRIIKMPHIEEHELESLWPKVWDHFKLGRALNPTKECPQDFLLWLKTLKLEGNFRDLQRIAILAADFQRAENVGLLTKKTLTKTGGMPLWFQELKSEFAQKQDPEKLSDENPLKKIMDQLTHEKYDAKQLIKQFQKILTDEISKRNPEDTPEQRAVKLNISVPTFNRWRK